MVWIPRAGKVEGLENNKGKEHFDSGKGSEG
jgi:hypothetical protein